MRGFYRAAGIECSNVLESPEAMRTECRKAAQTNAAHRGNASVRTSPTNHCRRQSAPTCGAHFRAD
eukprot:2504192-Pyramimonas_sp.AAC.1